MNRVEKNSEVEAIESRFSKMASAVLTDFRGLDVESMTALRDEFRKVGVDYKVVKNTLVKIAVKDEGYLDDLAPHLVEPTAIAWSYEDPVAPAKVVADFAKTNDKLRIKCAILDGKILDTAGVEQLSKMPGKDEIRSMFLAQLMAPAQSFVRLMAAGPTNFVHLLNARKRQQDGE